jgi:tetratricopeptide (TPR) repeat protein
VGHNLGGNMSKSLVNYYKYLGNYQQAINDLNKAIEINPKLAIAYYNRAISYSSLGNIDKTIEDYKIAASLGLEPAQVWLREQDISF